jgi:hypothetical protein
MDEKRASVGNAERNPWVYGFVFFANTLELYGFVFSANTRRT